MFGCVIFVIISLYSGVVSASGLQLGAWGLSSSSSWKRSGGPRSSVQVMGCPIFGLFFPFELELITHTG